jgi:hypothetical protein
MAWALRPFFAEKKYWLIFTVIALVVLSGSLFDPQAGKISYNDQVKPIFNAKCITCHGGVKEKGGFSLMTRADALKPTDSGQPAIIPGHPEKSEIIRRLTVSDPEERMPYDHPPLSKKEINILRDWVAEGANWGMHWAYLPVKKVNPPRLRGGFLGIFPAKNKRWIHNDIDRFILEKINTAGLTPSPQADKAALLRRISIDLIGMPAPDHLAKAFLKNDRPEAYTELVDSLLGNKHFGERWAAMWLDLARYSDSKGYERDYSRSIWPYRDWLIQAFNQDMPYDRFITEQIAGDLLPHPTDAQYIATGFHRNTPTNDEGGTDNEEFRVDAVLDRVNTTWEALMGTTFGCIQCHGHPYDPFKHDEYYQFMAFFDNTRDEDTYDEYPVLKLFSAKDSTAFLELKKWLAKNATSQRAEEVATFVKTGEPSINSIQADQLVNAALYDTKWLALRNHGIARLPQVSLSGKTQLIVRLQTSKNRGVWTLHLDAPKGSVLSTIKVKNTEGKWNIQAFDLPATAGVHDLFFTYENATEKDLMVPCLQFDWFHFTQPFPGKGKPGYEQQLATFWNLVNLEPRSTMIMMENPSDQRRISHVFERGNWRVKGKVVEPATPRILTPFPKQAPKNRLGLAQWLTDRQNPLTSRTMVNRLWEQLYGQGLVETLEDLGTQGIPPTHPELLDWLAWQYMNDCNWSTKKILRTMVLSATYQQSAKITPEAEAKDPYNRLYARAPRVRLSAEQIRDQALAVSGLMYDKMYGPSVMPYQPDGIWSNPWSSEAWQLSDAKEQHRRAIYTFWKRSAPYPSAMTFDAAAREVCTVRRVRTNTPLQALVMMNDPVYFEAAEHLAQRMARQGGKSLRDQISKGYELAIGHRITANKLAVLEKLYAQALNEDAKSKKIVDPKQSALTLVANAILNLDEFLCKS